MDTLARIAVLLAAVLAASSYCRAFAAPRLAGPYLMRSRNDSNRHKQQRQQQSPRRFPLTDRLFISTSVEEWNNATEYAVGAPTSSYSYREYLNERFAKRYGARVDDDNDDDDYCNVNDMSALLQVEIDLEREKTRLDSFQDYVIVSMLTAASSFSLISEMNVTPENVNMWTAAVIAGGLSTLCGLHSTVVFSLCSMYGRSALGMQRDSSYDVVISELAAQRLRGFRTFSASLMLFATEAALLLYQNVPAQLQPVAGMVGAGLTTLIASDWKTIVDTSKIIYSGGADDGSLPVFARPKQ